MPIDYDKYPKNWKSEIVPRILERADHKCEVCGIENKKYVYTINVYLKLPINDRYGYRKIWFRNELDAIKVEHLSHGPVKKVFIILTIAHLDHDEESAGVKDERLKAMCQYCHLNYDSKEKFRRAVEKGNN